MIRSVSLPAPSGPDPATPDLRGTRGRGVLRVLLTAGAVLSFTAAVLVFLLGVVATSGVYGSRVAWLVGVALPLLATTMLLTWSAARLAAGPRRGSSPSPAGARPGDDGRRMLFVAALVLFGVPVALVGILLSVDALIFVVHGVSLLL